MITDDYSIFHQTVWRMGQYCQYFRCRRTIESGHVWYLTGGETTHSDKCHQCDPFFCQLTNLTTHSNSPRTSVGPIFESPPGVQQHRLQQGVAAVQSLKVRSVAMEPWNPVCDIVVRAFGLQMVVVLGGFLDYFH